ncbi:MAG TPA: hypothetical protein VGX95_07020 [Xanthobacteraceae bacterium]|jgi:hypothetical protein|nr:hypothetical protein [Xanthobacteraceae bacterium]
MTKTSLPARSLQFALAFVAVIIASSVAPARAATHPPALTSDTGWPSELVNRPICGTDGYYDTRPACEAVRR